ncbi:hypothetical protein ACLI4Z_05495 [Natrialbaceae archaeon A-arb3/5]
MNFEDREKVIEELGLEAEKAEVYEDIPLIGFDFFKKNVFVNCWHMNSSESIAMWKLYLESDNGIAIKSSFQSLQEAVDTNEEYKTFISAVDYIDYEKEIMPEYNALLPFVYKRKEFEHEKELRTIIYSPPPSEPDGFDEEKGAPRLKTKWEEQPIGIDLEIDLENLIDGIHVAPKAPDWHIDTIKDILSTYELNVPVSRSGIKSEPYDPN